MKSKLLLSMAGLALLHPLAAKVPAGFNEDEAKVPAYQLPALLKTAGGRDITTAEDWRRIRRPEILQLLAQQMYGESPPLPAKVRVEPTAPPTPAVDGLAIRHQVTLHLSDAPDGPAMDLLLYLPRDAKGPVPLFWGLNFEGNHSVEADPAIPLSRSIQRMIDTEAADAPKRRKMPARGSQARRYPLEIPLKAGFGVATCCYHDIDPDFDDGFANGVHAMFPGQRNDASWGSLAAWAWGLRTGLDYFQSRGDIDGRKVVCMGHSRLGKAALWAGATDTRFALVISNESGCGGAALSKRRFGETVARINTAFPHWFCRNFRQYNDREADLPWDQHWLIACIAPRPVLVHSATEDQWADPKGEFLAAFHAGPAYQLEGKSGIGSPDMPGPGQAVGDAVGYYLRTGVHDVTAEDWQSYVRFASGHLLGKP